MLLTIEEAAQVIKKSPRTVRSMITKEKLPAIRKGRVLFIRLEDLPVTQEQRIALETQGQKVRQVVDRVLGQPVSPASKAAAATSDALTHPAETANQPRPPSQPSRGPRRSRSLLSLAAPFP